MLVILLRCLGHFSNSSVDVLFAIVNGLSKCRHVYRAGPICL